MTPKTDSVAVLRQIVAEIREELALVEGDRMEYAENAYRVSASVLEEWADRLQSAMLAALSAQGEDARDARKWRDWKGAQDRIENELPQGWAIELFCSPGDWSISLTDPDGKDVEIHDFDSMEDFIRRAIDTAKERAALAARTGKGEA